ncbi:hypothetical protein AA13595_1352 [Gluconacetobacter johannae DSM 13595]|uniref:Uncharacterized protein n=1 Tax=Gluconacetobacter johannae TaxID=112140 RepID=A0A7W4J9P3_9PROT|nr:hypothetical protein [Gluconacetobacter johannae]MBB2177264.1 hypothetical protein [Gluconacetobacter johannae]GBQ84229.1 hypothetical protein AA13595_1352 [Gluconacetobacter johannae DSM 13595]
MKAATVDPAPGGSGPLMATHLPAPVTIIDMTSQARATVAIRDIMPGVQADLDALGRVIRLRVQNTPPDLLPTA